MSAKPARRAAVLPTINDAKLLSFRSFVEPNGTLVALTGKAEVPFPIARIFYVYGMSAATIRGEHAHVECQQLLISLAGSCEVTVTDGTRNVVHRLESPEKGLWIPAGLWTHQRYLRDGTVLLVATDQPYSEDDYLREYTAFLEFRGLPKARRAG